MDNGTPPADEPPAGGDVALVDESTYFDPAHVTTVQWHAGFILSPDLKPDPTANASGCAPFGLPASNGAPPLFVTMNLTFGAASAMSHAEG